METKELTPEQKETLAEIFEVVIPQIKNVKTFAELEQLSDK